MKKKIVTMLLALILVISLVPMAAMAECAHPATNMFWASQGPSGHIKMCSCNEYVDTSSAGAPYLCERCLHAVRLSGP